MGLRQLAKRRCTRSAVKFRFVIEQQNCFERATQHLPCMHAALPWLGADKLRAHGIGRFGQEAKAGAGRLRNPGGHRLQGRGLRVVCCTIAQQHGFAFAA